MKKDWMIKESELDEDQIQVLMATLDKSCIVSGCAGSGKSVLALIKAQRIQKEKGKDYQIIVFTKALCNYMNSGKKELGLTNPFHYHWVWQNRLDAPHSDYIIVDEIQDFSKEEIEQFISSTNKNFFFFGDTAQSIYQGLKDTIAVDEIRTTIPNARSAKDWELYKNYRLPLPVARFVQQIGVGLPPFIEGIYKSLEKELPKVIKYDSKDKQIEAIHRIIESNNMDDVAILLPDNETVLKTYQALSKLGGNYEYRYNDKENFRNNVDNLNFDSTNPKIMTYHSAKGLQFETIFIPFIEDFVEDGDSNQKALYVAMTRTYRNLYVLISGTLPSPLSKIEPSLYKTTEVETIDDM